MGKSRLHSWEIKISHTLTNYGSNQARFMTSCVWKRLGVIRLSFFVSHFTFSLLHTHTFLLTLFITIHSTSSWLSYRLRFLFFSCFPRQPHLTLHSSQCVSLVIVFPSSFHPSPVQLIFTISPFPNTYPRLFWTLKCKRGQWNRDVLLSYKD